MENQNTSVKFVVTGTSFSVPVSHPSAATYSWDIYADGVFQGSYSGVGATDSSGIIVDFVADGEHVIELHPSDGQYTPGWARAFGFYTNSSGANSQANKDKLLRVISDPDSAHLESDTSAGEKFKAYQFYNCTNVTTAVEETLPVSVEDLGTEFRREQYSGCKSLV